MNDDKLNEIILEKLHALMQSQSELKASVDTYHEKVQDIKTVTVKHESLINHHSILFKLVFWVSTTIGGLIAAWAIKFK